MSNSEKRSFGQSLNIWVQTIGIIIAALWGGYTFIYKEVMIPKSVPVNITLDLQLKKIGTADLKSKDVTRGLIPVEMKFSAKNPSSREVYLLTSSWIVWGHKIVSLNSPMLPKRFIISEQNNNLLIQRHSKIRPETVVAYGGLFPDDCLKPNEVTTKTLLIYLPPHEYDYIEVHATMPTVAKSDVLEAEWTLNEKAQLKLTLYRLSAKGERKEMERNKDGTYTDKKLELQTAEGTSMLSLWQ